MKIAVIGHGNVGGALAKRFAEAGHQVMIGARDLDDEKVISLDKLNGISASSISDAAKTAEVIVISVPAAAASEVASSLGDVSGKIIIDTMNTAFAKLEGGFTNTADAILANCNTTDVVKCFNTTGFENMLNPVYHGEGIDMFVAGSSEKGKAVASQLAKEIGFSAVYDFGGNDKFFLIEQFAFSWINLAIIQKEGRGMAFKVLKR